MTRILNALCIGVEVLTGVPPVYDPTYHSTVCDPVVQQSEIMPGYHVLLHA
jgi:hypothetical protein